MCVLTSVFFGGVTASRYISRVKETVVVARTEQRGEDPALGSGVVIPRRQGPDGRHVGAAADKILGSILDNQLVPPALSHRRSG